MLGILGLNSDEKIQKYFGTLKKNPRNCGTECACIFTKKLSLCHKLKFSNPYIFATDGDISIFDY